MRVSEFWFKHIVFLLGVREGNVKGRKRLAEETEEG